MSAPNSVFRIATKQAIKEIIEAPSEKLQYGLILTDENLEDITSKVVDLFEMTLDLRSRTQELFKNLYKKNNEETEDTPVSHNYFKSKSSKVYKETTQSLYKENSQVRNVIELPKGKEEKSKAGSRVTSQFLLPRKRMLISQEEKKKLLERL